jgi:hypothetical protein
VQFRHLKSFGIFALESPTFKKWDTLEQTPTLLRAIRTVPSSVSPVAKAISSDAESFVRAEMGVPDDFSMVFSSM